MAYDIYSNLVRLYLKTVYEILKWQALQFANPRVISVCGVESA
jgi:hypothetical protein